MRCVSILVVTIRIRGVKYEKILILIILILIVSDTTKPIATSLAKDVSKDKLVLN